MIGQIKELLQTLNIFHPPSKTALILQQLSFSGYFIRYFIQIIVINFILTIILPLNIEEEKHESTIKIICFALHLTEFNP